MNNKIITKKNCFLIYIFLKKFYIKLKYKMLIFEKNIFNMVNLIKKIM